MGIRLMYTYKIGISEEEHDQFVLSHPLATLLQSSQWAKVKDNWKHELLGFYRDGSLVATAACLIRPLPLGFSMIYVPRGPILDYSDFDLLRFVISSLKAFGKTKKALSIKLDPSLLIKSAHIDQDSDENGQTLSTIAFLKSLGLDWSGRTQHLEETIQPRFQANIFACDFSLDQLSKKAKQSIRTATNKGVEISFGQTELLEEFAQLMKKTENRKGIILRGIDYYRKLLDTYQDQSFITMARLNLEEQEKTVRNQLEKALELQQQFTEKVSQARSAKIKKPLSVFKKKSISCKKK